MFPASQQTIYSAKKNMAHILLKVHVPQNDKKTHRHAENKSI